MFGTCETFSGLGFMLGPVIGSGLYEAGGFKTPFFVLGFMVIFIGLTAIYTLPPNKTTRGRDYGTFRTYMKIPGVIVTLLSVFTITFGLGFIDASFSAHLKMVRALFQNPALMTSIIIFWQICSTKITGRNCQNLRFPNKACLGS